MVKIFGKKYEGVCDEKSSSAYDPSFELEDVEDIEDKIVKYLASGQAMQDQRYRMYFGDDDNEVSDDDINERSDCEFESDYIALWNKRVAQKRELLRNQQELLKKTQNSQDKNFLGNEIKNQRADRVETKTPEDRTERSEERPEDG